jgi:hypothetical protein
MLCEHSKSSFRSVTIKIYEILIFLFLSYTFILKNVQQTMGGGNSLCISTKYQRCDTVSYEITDVIILFSVRMEETWIKTYKNIMFTIFAYTHNLTVVNLTTCIWKTRGVTTCSLLLSAPFLLQDIMLINTNICIITHTHIYILYKGDILKQRKEHLTAMCSIFRIFWILESFSVGVHKLLNWEASFCK